MPVRAFFVNVTSFCAFCNMRDMPFCNFRVYNIKKEKSTRCVRAEVNMQYDGGMQQDEEREQPRQEDAGKNNRGKYIAMAVLAAAFVFFCALGGYLGNKPVFGFALMFLMPIAAIALCLVHRRLKACSPQRSVLPYAALLMSLSCLYFAGVLSLLVYGGGFLLLVGLFLIIAMFAVPVMGMAFGILTVVGGKKRYGRAGMACGISAIVIPVIVVIVVLALLSARVIVISLM